MNMLLRASALISPLLIAGCETFSTPPGDGASNGPPWCAPSPPANPGGNNPVESSTDVLITQDDNGDYEYYYCGFFASSDGDLHFKGKPQSTGRPVTIKFKIDHQNSVSGIKFADPATSVMMIEERTLGDGEACVGGTSPTSTTLPDQFSNPQTNGNRRTFTIDDANDDGGCYTFSLTFELSDGTNITDDPDIRNDGTNSNPMELKAPELE